MNTTRKAKALAPIDSYLPFVDKVARRVARRLPPSVSFDDLVSAGRLGLVEAFKRYNPALNDNFAAYAELRIRGAIFDEVRSMDWAPRAVRRRSQLLRRAEQSLTNSLGRKPEREELAAHLDMSAEGLQRVEQELKAVLLVEGDVLDRVGHDSEPNPAKCLIRHERVDQLAAAIEKLPERERKVIAMYYLQDMRLKQIGQHLGVTESRVCQLHTRALSRLQEGLSKLDGFLEHLAA